MADCWRRGSYEPVEHFLDLYPGLRDSPVAVMDLVYEEICLCREYGRAVDPDEIVRRFPRWKRQIDILLNCVDVLGAALVPSFPTVGETFGDFRLVAQLGRGGQGIVFAATQSSLGNRPVVLKITSCRGDEHLSLARLQHTHIVPLLSVLDDPGRNLRVLCMPYFGGLTLAALLAELRERPQRAGRDILACLDAARASAPIVLPPPGHDPAMPFLERATWVEAITWVGACLAEALKYAHERGLVHLDLKPSNVLLTADRQPMLLDFHLAREPLRPGDGGARFGGTPAYMSPEQKRSMAAIKEGYSVPEAIDGRSDVYSLGLLLYEALAGKIPEARSPGDSERPLLPLSRCNPGVSAGLSDIIAKCLAVRPEQRYQDGGMLAADLWAHLNDLPLKGVANRSFAERWRKWRRRKPHLLSFAVMFAAVVVVSGAAIIMAVLHFSHRVTEARTALAESDKLITAGRYGDGSAAAKRGFSQLENLPGNRELKLLLLDRQVLAARAQAAQELHDIADRFRLLYGMDFFPSGKLQALDAHCNEFWAKRDVILERLGRELEPHIEQRLQLDLLDLAILGADLRVRLAGKDRVATARREALQMLAQAETLFGPNAVLYHERRLHAQALGLAHQAREAERRASECPPRTAWEHYALGRALLRANQLDAAASRLERALAIQPDSIWPSFYHGVCCYRLGKFQDSALAFTTCTALAPNVAACFHNRGLAFLGLKRADRALADLNRALELDPAFAEAAFSRGLLHFREKRLNDAAADFLRAIEKGANRAHCHFQLALVCMARNDRAQTIMHLKQSRRFDAGHKEASELLRKLERQP